MNMFSDRTKTLQPNDRHSNILVYSDLIEYQGENDRLKMEIV